MVLQSDDVGNFASDLLRIDLADFLLLPGLINAHDHLEFSLFPRLADPPYSNYIEWGEDIHAKFIDVITIQHAIPKSVRVWWGGIRNLLCGVTTVCHHNPLHSEMLRDDFPVRVVREYGWAHSLGLGGNLCQLRAAVPNGIPFIVHACEGTDELAAAEAGELERMGLLDAQSVLVHGLALNVSAIDLMKARHSSLIACLSSNQFLFDKLPDLVMLSAIDNLALGNDSPLTAVGDLLDEIHLAIKSCHIAPQTAYRMVTIAAAAVLHLKNGEGTIREDGVADLIALYDTGKPPADRFRTLTLHDVEFVMVGGRVQLVSERLLERLPPSIRLGLKPLSIDGITRWLRAPVSSLLHHAQVACIDGQLSLGSRIVAEPVC